MRPFFKILLAIFVGVLVLPFVLDSGTISVVAAVAFGWISFLLRSLPKWKWNWDLIGMGLICATIILFLSHQFLTALSRSVASKFQNAFRWPWKWTWSLFVATLLFFIVGMAVTGVVHQVGWMAASPESLLERKGFYFVSMNEMKQIDLAIRIASGERDGTIESTREEFWKTKDQLFAPRVDVSSLFQKYCVLAVIDPQGKVSGTIIFPRDSKLKKLAGAFYNFDDKDGFERKWDKMLDKIKRQRDRLVTF